MEWGKTSSGWTQSTAIQNQNSVELLIEVARDRPIDAYDRTDGERLRQTLRQIPTTYRKSPKDRDRALAEIIEAADKANTPRLSEKTLKRHFGAISRFFVFLIETGRLPRTSENIGQGFTFNTRGPVRNQRDMWSGEELIKLFTSPIWTGHLTSIIRTQPGGLIIRDAKFWLPLLGLYHGNRLKEFAQLRSEDLRQQEDGIWFLRITDDDGRQLKTEQSRRNVPLHSELIKLGFLQYVAQIAPLPQSSLFPDLNPGGPDEKLGYYFSKDFSYYRGVIGLRRKGLDYHSFRHGVTTKLYEAEISEGWIDLLTGHDSGGGESRRQYLIRNLVAVIETRHRVRDVA